MSSPCFSRPSSGPVFARCQPLIVPGCFCKFSILLQSFALCYCHCYWCLLLLSVGFSDSSTNNGLTVYLVRLALIVGSAFRCLCPLDAPSVRLTYKPARSAFNRLLVYCLVPTAIADRAGSTTTTDHNESEVNWSTSWKSGLTPVIHLLQRLAHHSHGGAALVSAVVFADGSTPIWINTCKIWYFFEHQEKLGLRREKGLPVKPATLVDNTVWYSSRNKQPLESPRPFCTALPFTTWQTVVICPSDAEWPSMFYRHRRPLGAPNFKLAPSLERRRIGNRRRE